MRTNLLSVLECPFCGGSLRVEKGRFVERTPDEIFTAILLCDCCAYPIADGIPYLRTGRDAQRALEAIGTGDAPGALSALLGTNEESTATVLADESLTFAEMLNRLDARAEGRYLLYRFSDPTFLSSEAVLLALASHERCARKPILDLCGGAGHLSRALCGATPRRDVVLADLSFWKLYLAKRFVAPNCQPVCCDANEPLPFKRDAFSLVSCADAFHYIWSKRQLAGEMQRLGGKDGVVALPHVHNGLSWNYSQGMALPPTGYWRLFEGAVRVFDEPSFLNAALGGGAINFARNVAASDLDAASALVIVAARSESFFPFNAQSAPDFEKPLRVNPLYQRDESSGEEHWKRTFPSADYEEEYAACKEYLPEQVQLTAEQLARAERGQLDAHLRSLARRRVLLDLPACYV